MPNGFEDDFAIVEKDKQDSAMELTDREKAIASGRNPDKVEDEAEEGTEEEAEDKDVEDTEAAASDEGKEAHVPDWADDTVKELAESYGIDEEGLASFESKSDFDRFTLIYEKTAGKPEPKAEKAKDEKPAEKEEAEEPPTVDDIDPQSFIDEGYDEKTVEVVKAVAAGNKVVKGLLERIEQLESRLVEGDRRREQEALSREIDEIGGRFGTGDKLTSSQRKAREKLLEAAEVVKLNLEKRGEKASTAVVLRRAELVAFGDEILAEERARQKEEVSQRVKRQSAKRRSVGRNTKPPARRERLGEAADPVKAIANSPELVEFWNSAQD